MIGFDLKVMKSGFFDRGRVMRSMSQAKRKSLSRFGAFVRQRAKTSIRKRKGVSAPGTPPHSHVGLIRDNILFALEGEDNVVIGPFLLNGRSSKGALAALEHGGESLIMQKGKGRRARIAARPFMQPAFEKELPKAAAGFENSMR